MSALLGLAWGLVLVGVLHERAARRRVRARARSAAGRRRRDPRRRGRLAAGVRRTWSVVAARTGVVGRVLAALARRRRARRADDATAAALPVTVDLLAVAFGSGCTPYLALDTAATWSPAATAGPLTSVVRACRQGMGLDDALRALGHGTPPLRPLADTLGPTVRLGAPVGDALARLAADARADLRRRAEQRARAVPVRLLFPLVFLVLPAFVLLTVAPALLAGFSAR